MLERAGYAVKGLDIARRPAVDIVGTAEATGMADESVDLVLCTQVLEHTRAPWLAMREFAARPSAGRQRLLSIPHVWFFHPHPHDYWRITAEGMAALFDEGDFKVVGSCAGGQRRSLCQVVNFLAFGALGRAVHRCTRSATCLVGRRTRWLAIPASRSTTSAWPRRATSEEDATRRAVRFLVVGGGVAVASALAIMVLVRVAGFGPSWPRRSSGSRAT